ncbi:hypothetical protein E6C60_4196 [Paenibacillus algicola]|uniref:DUF4446 domain-containing protein n=1 Tax=Paenibacillus algicola TaxID=2565926 RepID=A0A4P8XSK7_9BACL|nr:DUF4446 family protein [Paenibacillus algicola]QCT04901.1 hypothetical protein E6C60_4196 [Paenibacillus algicola]
MSEWNEWILEQLHWVAAGAVLVILLLWIIVLVQGLKIRRMSKKYNAMMSGSGVEDLESLLLNLKIQLDAVEEEQGQHREHLASVGTALLGIKTRTGIVRYNAFGERGNDLSFSLALLSKKGDGLVLTGLYNRDNSFVYAKPVKNSESSHTLSPEEKEAIRLALQED